MRETLTLHLPPELEALSLLGTRLRPFLEARFGALPICYEVELAAVELVSNVVRHNSPGSPLRLCCSCWEEAIVLTLHDDGFEYDMSANCPAEPPQPLQESGRGIWLVQGMADRFSFRRDAGQNVHTFIKRVPAETGKAATPMQAPGRLAH